MNDFTARIIHEFNIPFQGDVLVFAVLLFIILFVNVISNRLSLPSIVGLILAGVLVGPYGLGLLEETNAIELLSTIGLLYIMFIVGLELDINEFKANKYFSISFGLLTFSIPMVITYLVVNLLLHQSVITSLLVGIMFATHTLVAYPIVSKLGISKNDSVAVTVGGTVITDIIALTVLAIIIRYNSGTIDFAFFMQLILSLMIFSFILFFVIPKVAKWFFKKVESEKYTHYVFVLFIVFFSGFLAELGGLEPIIGAFLAGLALNALIPDSSSLMNRIEFIGNALFIPFFLISVGMMLDVSVVFEGIETIIITSVLLLVAVSSKWFAAQLSGWFFKYNALQRNLIFGLSTARAAATLAIALVGFRAGIINESYLNAVILLILATCIISSFITQNAARQIAVSQKDKPIKIATLENANNEKILVPIANPSHINHHIKLAMLLKEHASSRRIALLGVVRNDTESEKNIIDFRENLQGLVEDATAADVDVEVITTVDNNPASGILRTATEVMADTVIMGWPGKSAMIDRLIGIGDVVDSVIRNLDKNLFVCHFEEKLIEHKRILLLSPPQAERETGFGVWVSKLAKLASELSISITQYGHPATFNVIKEHKKIASPFTFIELTDWEDPLSFCNEVKKDDIIILVSAHQGYISYLASLENLPNRLERRYPNYSRIVIYPKQNAEFNILENQGSIFTP